MPREQMCGVISIDKPAGLTSRQVVDRVARCVRPAKAGHAGTLDPLATGVLVLCVGPATRLISEIQSQPKQYRATFLLGQTSNTDDIEGEIQHTDLPVAPNEAAIQAALATFIGDVPQVPPQFSAVHVNGQRAYARARAGETVELTARTVSITRIDLLHYVYPQLDLEIACGSGTYIRSIARDLGQRLGCGALMSALVRTRIGQFTLANSLALDKITPDAFPGCLAAPLTAVAHLPRYRCTEEELRQVRRGRPILPSLAFEPIGTDRTALLTPAGTLAALAEWSSVEKHLAPRIVLPETGPS